MIDFFLHLFDPSEPPTSTRGGALSNATGWMHLSSDMAIFFAYAVICTLLMIFLYRQRHLPHRPTIWLIWLFMLACGITRLIGAAMLYYPAFRLLLVIKILTAAVSLITVFALAKIFPTMLELESDSVSHRRASDIEDQHRQSKEDLSEQRDKLEQRATQLTVRDRRVRRALESTSTAACSWDSSSNELIWEVGLKDLLGVAHEDPEPAQSWSQFLAAPQCERILAAARHACATGAELAIDLPISLADGRDGMLSIRARCESTPTPVTHAPKSIVTGLVSFLPASVPA